MGLRRKKNPRATDDAASAAPSLAPGRELTVRELAKKNAHSASIFDTLQNRTYDERLKSAYRAIERAPKSDSGVIIAPEIPWTITYVWQCNDTEYFVVTSGTLEERIAELKEYWESPNVPTVSKSRISGIMSKLKHYGEKTHTRSDVATAYNAISRAKKTLEDPNVYYPPAVATKIENTYSYVWQLAVQYKFDFTPAIRKAIIKLGAECAVIEETAALLVGYLMGVSSEVDLGDGFHAIAADVTRGDSGNPVISLESSQDSARALTA